MDTLSPCYTKWIFPSIHQLKYWERSMLMKCICTSITKMGLPPRRKIWLTKLVKKKKGKTKIQVKEECDTPGVYFVLCWEIYPNLGCSVKISISRSYLSHVIKLLMKVSPNMELFDLKNCQIWSLLKLLFLEANANSKVNLVQTHLFGLPIVVVLSNRCPNPNSRLQFMSDYLI
jgi:hypothetical protein